MGPPDFVFKEKHHVVLAGSGLSSVPPTSLPDWWELNDAVLGALGGAVERLTGAAGLIEVDPEPETAGTGWLVMVWRQRVKRREGAQGERLGFSPAPGFSRGVDGEAAASPPFRPLVG